MTLSNETRKQLEGVSTATLATALFKRGLRNQVIQNVSPLGKLKKNMVGPAYTLRYIPAREDLNEITAFENDLDRTLSAAIGTNFVNDNEWLTDCNTRFLFLLDGFDELLLERGANTNLRNFIEQVEKFQQRILFLWPLLSHYL